MTTFQALIAEQGQSLYAIAAAMESSQSHLAAALRGRRAASLQFWQRLGRVLGLELDEVGPFLQLDGRFGPSGAGGGTRRLYWVRQRWAEPKPAPAETLRAHVDEAGRTVTELALLLGVQRSHLSEMVSGRRAASLRLLLMLGVEVGLEPGETCELLGVSPGTPLDAKVRAR